MTSSSLKDDKSARTWGTQIRTTPVSPISTWGTLPTTSSSNPSLQAVIDHKTSWGSPTDTSVSYPQGWTSNCSPPLYPSPSSTMSNPLSVGTYSGYSSPSLISPSSLASPAGSWTQLSPLLDSRSPQCIEFDLGLALNYMPNMNESAVMPPVTFMQLVIIAQPFKWLVNIQAHGPVCVHQVLQNLQQYLQGYPNAQDLQKSKLGCNVSPSDRFREQSRPNTFHSGQKRIDFLGRHRVFRGLSLEPGPKCAWVVHLSDR